MSDKLLKLKTLAKELFKNNGEWLIVKLEWQEDRRDYEHKIISSFNDLDDKKKSDVLQLVCQSKYSVEQIVYLRLNGEFSDVYRSNINIYAGFALLEDDFCFFKKSESEKPKIKIRPYKEINTDNLVDIAFLFTFNGDFKHADELCFIDLEKKDLEKNDLEKDDLEKSDLEKSDLEKSDLEKSDLEKIKEFIDAAKNL